VLLAGSVAVAVIISPEKLDDERGGTHLDDIYSLGATIYELLKVSREAC